ncbi:MAG: RsmD family RNA methyltransferase [Deferrisomatales bacterium]
MGTVRIISGRLRGRQVGTPPGLGTRPLLTRLRKSLVDVLRPRLRGAAVLDLFGGSGAIAFELLSNGAERATVVELDPAAATTIRRNAAALGLGDAVEALTGDALDAAARLTREGRSYQVVMIAPPYGRGLEQRALDAVAGPPLRAPGGVAVVQRDGRDPRPEPPPGLALVRTREYGRTAFDFYEGAEP